VTKAPHILPKYVTDHMVLLEITYQTYVHGVGSSLAQKNKYLWPHLLVTIGAYSFNTFAEAQKTTKTSQSFHFGEERFQRHDQKVVV